MTGAADSEYLEQQELNRFKRRSEIADNHHQQVAEDPANEEPVKPIEARSAGADNKLQQQQQQQQQDPPINNITSVIKVNKKNRIKGRTIVS